MLDRAYRAQVNSVRPPPTPQGPDRAESHRPAPPGRRTASSAVHDILPPWPAFASIPRRQSGVTKVSLIVPGTGAERRRDKRYQVDLTGTLRSGGTTSAVIVSDLSASGALVSIPRDPAESAASEVVLVVDAFGPIEARIVHVGDGFYGLRFLQPPLLRDRLARWLQQDVGST